MTLVEDSIRFIHKITKSHSNQHKFRKLIDSANLQPRKLTKPVKTRWITCRSALSESLQYRDIILQVLADDKSEKTIQLCATMSNPENLLRIASIVLLLNRTTETNNLLQRTVLSLADSKTVIDSLRVELGSLTSDVPQFHTKKSCWEPNPASRFIKDAEKVIQEERADPVQLCEEPGGESQVS
ncbi:hypothetical protein BLNAU_8738 [Blattamonas nauphoetae]|uniref:Uncharacterized protein n=1 Tax=Blattamonas nauphoetae TaxID=2049346 RepID=A0ABQ9XY03_9EUKA|nr:hypothetical protein BLNAU_8738 [Blattamonas nauphoetae]